MPQFNSLRLLNELQQQTETFLQTAVQQWQMLPTGKLLQPPAPGSWSVAQCLEHLNSYGRYYLPALEQSIISGKQKEAPRKGVFKSGWLGNLFTNMMLPKGEAKKVKKMKAPKNHTPPAQLNSDAVVAEFIDEQEKLLQLLEEAKLIDLRTAKVAISIAPFIKLSVGDTFRFLIAHNYRHILQAERALAAQAKVVKNEKSNQTI